MPAAVSPVLAGTDAVALLRDDALPRFTVAIGNEGAGACGPIPIGAGGSVLFVGDAPGAGR